MTTALVDVECVCLDLGALRVERDALEATLASDERAHADRHGSPALRERFVLRLGALRRLLAAREGLDPATLALRAGAAGKPSLLGSDLRFSASSSGDVFAVAFARGVDVGLDVERLREVEDLEPGADAVLTARDRARLGALPCAARGEAYLRLFTLREALAKRDGSGIAGGGGGEELPLEALTGDGTFRLHTPGGATLSLLSRTIGGGVRLALAVAGPVRVRWALGPFGPAPDERPVVVPAWAR